MSFVMRLTIAQLHKIQVNPYLVMEALIGLSDTQREMHLVAVLSNAR